MQVFMSESSTVCCLVYGPGSRGVGVKGEMSMEVSPRMYLSEVGTQDLQNSSSVKTCTLSTTLTQGTLEAEPPVRDLQGWS